MDQELKWGHPLGVPKLLILGALASRRLARRAPALERSRRVSPPCYPRMSHARRVGGDALALLFHLGHGSSM
jgi:hypothetical protein